MTQGERILKYLEKHDGITTLAAFQKLGITRLSGRIFDLRAKGYKFTKTTETSTNRFGEQVSYARYRPVKEITADGGTDE